MVVKRILSVSGHIGHFHQSRVEGVEDEFGTFGNVDINKKKKRTKNLILVRLSRNVKTKLSYFSCFKSIIINSAIEQPFGTYIVFLFLYNYN